MKANKDITLTKRRKFIINRFVLTVRLVVAEAGEPEVETDSILAFFLCVFSFLLHPKEPGTGYRQGPMGLVKAPIPAPKTSPRPWIKSLTCKGLI